jgi:hypothetical protein
MRAKRRPPELDNLLAQLPKLNFIPPLVAGGFDNAPAMFAELWVDHFNPD